MDHNQFPERLDTRPLLLPPDEAGGTIPSSPLTAQGNLQPSAPPAPRGAVPDYISQAPVERPTREIPPSEAPSKPAVQQERDLPGQPSAPQAAAPLSTSPAPKETQTDQPADPRQQRAEERLEVFIRALGGKTGSGNNLLSPEPPPELSAPLNTVTPPSPARPPQQPPRPNPTTHTYVSDSAALKHTDDFLTKHHEGMRAETAHIWSPSDPTDVLARTVAGGGLPDLIRELVDNKTAKIIDTAAAALGGETPKDTASPSEIVKYIQTRAQDGHPPDAAALVAAADTTEKYGLIGYQAARRGPKDFQELWIATNRLLNNGSVYSTRMGLRNSAASAPLLYAAAAEQVGNSLNPENPDPNQVQLSVAIAEASVDSYGKFGAALSGSCPAVSEYNKEVVGALRQLAAEQKLVAEALNQFRLDNPTATQEQELDFARGIAQKHKLQGSGPIVAATVTLATDLAAARMAAREARTQQDTAPQRAAAAAHSRGQAIAQASGSYNTKVFDDTHQWEKNLTAALDSADAKAILDASMAVFESRAQEGISVQRRHIAPQTPQLLRYLAERLPAISAGSATPAELIFVTDFANHLGFALPQTDPALLRTFADQLRGAVQAGALRHYGVPARLKGRDEYKTGSVTPTDKGVVRPDKQFADVRREPLVADMDAATRKLGPTIVRAYTVSYVREILKAGEEGHSAHPVVVQRRQEFLSVVGNISDNSLHARIVVLKAAEQKAEADYQKGLARAARTKRIQRLRRRLGSAAADS